MWKIFFVICTQHDGIDEYRKGLADDIFSCMEMSKQGYVETVLMPVKRFRDYLKWKDDLDEAKLKAINERTII